MESRDQKCDLLDDTVSELSQYLCIPKSKNRIIRIHTKKLKQLGEISFPLDIKNWHKIVDHENKGSTILDYVFLKKIGNIPEASTEIFINNLKCESKNWCLSIDDVKIENDNVLLFLGKYGAFRETIMNCLCMREKFGAIEEFSKFSFNIRNEKDFSCNLKEINLTDLRLMILKRVSYNLTEFKLNNSCDSEPIIINLGTKRYEENDIVCGNVINKEGSKDSSTSAGELYRKRSVDMRLMAEHKYRLNIKCSDSWNEYFEKLGEASITIELLQNKPHKNVKITLNDLSSANKGASFIFYNCARLSVLFNEFEKRVNSGIYPKLISVENVDFTLLNQPEEWELLYVYILQYPLMIHTCIQDVRKGIVNPHYIVAFLSNMCSLFSAYYRRIRILVNPKPHLIPTIQARIYLLKSLEQVFHNSLALLNIDPIKEM